MTTLESLKAAWDERDAAFMVEPYHVTGLLRCQKTDRIVPDQSIIQCTLVADHETPYHLYHYEGKDIPSGFPSVADADAYWNLVHAREDHERLRKVAILINRG